MGFRQVSASAVIDVVRQACTRRRPLGGNPIVPCLMRRILLTGTGLRQTRGFSHYRDRFDYLRHGHQTYLSERSSEFAA